MVGYELTAKREAEIMEQLVAIRRSRSDIRQMRWTLLVMALVFTLSAACKEAGGRLDNADSAEISETTGDAKITEFALEQVNESGVTGKVRFEMINKGTQLTLEVSHLPKPGAPYYAQIHKGDCADVQSGESPEYGQHHGRRKIYRHAVADIPVAMLNLDQLLAKVLAHNPSTHKHNTVEDELPGNVDQPIDFLSSADRSASVTTLLEGVAVDRIRFGQPKYLDLHAGGSEDESSLACVELAGTN